MRWSHGHVMLCVTCLLKLLVSKIELGTRALCRAVFFKRLHDVPFGCLEGPSLEVILHTVCLAGRSATASHAREGLARDATHGVKKRTGVALKSAACTEDFALGWLYDGSVQVCDATGS